MRTLALSTLALMLLTGVCSSQEHEPGENPNTIAGKAQAEADRARAERKKQAQIDAAYRATLKKEKVPAAVSTDPWADVRPTSTTPARQ